MSVYQETGRIRPDVLRFVQEEIHHGVNGDSYGYHGTSVHTLLAMLHTGVIPGRTNPAESHIPGFPKPGDVYFWKPEPGDYKSADAIDKTKTYALLIAQKHSVVTELGLSLANREHICAAMDLTDIIISKATRERRVAYLTRQGLSEIQIRQAVIHAKELKGVLVGVSPQVADTFPIVDCAPDDGWKIETLTGLPFQFLQGIKFLSLQDEQLFRQHLAR